MLKIGWTIKAFLDDFFYFARTFFAALDVLKLVDRQCGRTPFGVHVFDDVFLWRTSAQAHWNHSIGPTCPGQLPKSMLLV